jgi:hypothetical protein
MRATTTWGAALGVLFLGVGCEIIAGVRTDLRPYPAGTGGPGGSGGTGGKSPGPTCHDNTKNGDETGKDCGGSCSRCPDGEGCKSGGDCESKSCSAGGTCLPATCSDSLKNGDETDADCGGGAASGCPACTDGKACGAGDDCAHHLCVTHICTNPYVWGHAYDGASPTVLAVDSAGRIALAGNFVGTADFGGGPVTSSNSFVGDLFVARLGPAGDHLWDRTLAGSGTPFMAGAAIDSIGSVVLAGRFNAQLDVAGTAMTAAGLQDTFLVKLDGFGNPSWAKQFGAAGARVTTRGVAIESNQYIVVAGALQGSASLGGAPLTSAGGSDVFVARLLGNGQLVWSKRFGGAGEQAAMALSVDGSNNVLLAGTFDTAVDLGGGALPSQGGTDVFVAKLDPAGNHVWSVRFGDAADQAVELMALDGSGNMILAGSFQGAPDFGGGPLAAGAGKSWFVVKLDASGQHVWSRAFTDASDLGIKGLAVDGAGNVLAAGYFATQVDFGGGTLTSTGGTGDLFTLKLSATGEHMWSASFGSQGAGGDNAQGIAAASNTSAIVAGAFGGSIDLGGVPLTSLGASAAFLAKLTTP